MSLEDGPADAMRSSHEERLREIRAAYAARLRAIVDDLPHEMAGIAADYRALADQVEAGDADAGDEPAGG